MIYWLRELEIQLEELLESLGSWDLESLSEWMRSLGIDPKHGILGMILGSMISNLLQYFRINHGRDPSPEEYSKLKQLLEVKLPGIRAKLERLI